MAKNTDYNNVKVLTERAKQNNINAWINTAPNKIVIAGKPPKPKRDRQLNVQIDAKHLEKIKTYAKDKGLSVAELLEQLIDML